MQRSNEQLTCDRLLICGGSGLVGSALVRYFRKRPDFIVFAPTSSDVNLLDRDQIRGYTQEIKPDIIINAAGHVGGIHANNTYPYEFISKNLRMQSNLLDAALNASIERFLFLGSSCIYPRDAIQPIKEDYLLSGKLEETNKPYAIAKIAGITEIQAIRRQFGLKYVTVMPTNLYGPNDNFDPLSSHVLPGLIGKFVRAKEANDKEVELWGTGSPLREFLHVDDLASAIAHILNGYDNELPINVGSGLEVTIKNLAEIISRSVEFNGTIRWKQSMPDGTPRKILDSSRIRELGWTPTIELQAGIQATVKWYQESIKFSA